MIPKTIFQVSENKLHPLIVRKILDRSNGWKYLHFNDFQILKFFEAYKVDGLENISDVFMSIKTGAHKADLFRYYYLYIFGGLYLDTDLMIYANADSICKDVEFITCNSSYCQNTLFQGLIGSAPGNKVILKALHNLYNVDKTILKENYLWVVSDLYQVFHDSPKKFSFRLYEEKFNDPVSAKIVDDNDMIIGIHYFALKKIPIRDQSLQNKFKLFSNVPVTPIKFNLF